MAYDVRDFQTDVIEASYVQPVLVDFWAPWCGPCRMLSPTLERLAEEQADRWTLVKINSDEYPDLSRRYGVRGIPNVKLFIDGTVADEFTGALPEPAIRSWLDEAIPSESRKQLAAARAHLDAGAVLEARSLLEDLVAADPADDEARVLLARSLALEHPVRARHLLEDVSLSDPDLIQVADSIRTLARLKEIAGDPSALDESPARDTYLAAVRAFDAGDYDGAVQRFIQVLMQDRYYDDDGARKAGLALFTLLGPEHPVTRSHRRLFDMTLWV